MTTLTGIKRITSLWIFLSINFSVTLMILTNFFPKAIFLTNTIDIAELFKVFVMTALMISPQYNYFATKTF